MRGPFWPCFAQVQSLPHYPSRMRFPLQVEECGKGHLVSWHAEAVSPVQDSPPFQRVVHLTSRFWTSVLPQEGHLTTPVDFSFQMCQRRDWTSWLLKTFPALTFLSFFFLTTFWESVTCYKIHPFEMYNSMFVSIFMELCNGHCNLILEYFHHPLEKPHAH